VRPAVDEPGAAPFQVSRRFMYIEEYRGRRDPAAP